MVDFCGGFKAELVELQSGSKLCSKFAFFRKCSKTDVIFSKLPQSANFNILKAGFASHGQLYLDSTSFLSLNDVDVVYCVTFYSQNPQNPENQQNRSILVQIKNFTVYRYRNFFESSKYSIHIDERLFKSSHCMYNK